MAVGTLNYKMNKWTTFVFEQSLYTTHANPEETLPLFRGVPSREWNDLREEFGPSSPSDAFSPENKHGKSHGQRPVRGICFGVPVPKHPPRRAQRAHSQYGWHAKQLRRPRTINAPSGAPHNLLILYGVPDGI